MAFQFRCAPPSFQKRDGSTRQTDSVQTLTQFNEEFSTLGLTGSHAPRAILFTSASPSEHGHDTPLSSSSASQPSSVGTNYQPPTPVVSLDGAHTSVLRPDSSATTGSRSRRSSDEGSLASAHRRHQDEASQDALRTQEGALEARIISTAELTPTNEISEQSPHARASRSTGSHLNSPDRPQNIQQKTDTGKEQPVSQRAPSSTQSSPPRTPKNNEDCSASIASPRNIESPTPSSRKGGRMPKSVASSPAVVQTSSLSTPKGSAGRRRSITPSSRTLDETKTTTKVSNSMLKDQGVVISNTLEPGNFSKIQETLLRPRKSPIPQGDFARFRECNENACNETLVKCSVVPILGGDDMSLSMTETKFNKLAKFFEDDGVEFDVAAAQPDQYDGCKSKDVRPVIRKYKDLEQYIMPSNLAGRLCLPNFFIELKGPLGIYGEVRRQACYNGVLGARAMHKLRCLTYEDDALDGNAYTITATFAGGEGSHTLTLYAVHPLSSKRGRASDDSELAIDYRMTLLRSFALCDSQQTYEEGVTALRNAYDWAKEQRNTLVAEAKDEIQ